MSDEPVICLYCGAEIVPGPRTPTSAWAGANGEPCEASAPGHAPKPPPPMMRWHIASTGERVRAGLVAGRQVRSERIEIERINAEAGREVYRLEPLDGDPPG